MATISTDAPPISGTDVSPSSIPATAAPETTQIIPGTTVIGTGATGDIWSYTIPDITSVVPISVPTSAVQNPPENTLVLTTVVLAGTTVTGGAETGVPWSYTIPDATFLSSVLVPVTAAPTSTAPLSEPVSSSPPVTESLTTPTSDPTTSIPSDTFTSSLADPSLTSSASSSSSIPSVPPATSDSQNNNAALSGGIVGAVFGGLLLLIFAGALCLCLRLRRRRRAGGADWDKPPEKGIGVVWGMGWGRDKKDRRAWRNVRPGMTPGGESGGSSGLGSRTRLNADPETQETSEQPSSGGRTRIKYPYPAPTPDLSTPHNNSFAHTTSPDDPHPSNSSQYLQPHSDPNTRATTPNIKSPRSIPPPTQFVYAPQPPPAPEPERMPAPVPDLYRAASPSRAYQSSVINRPTSPQGSGSTSPTHRMPGPNRLSKQRATPSASALLRHMVPTRGASLRRSRAGPSASSTASGSESTARPGISTLPSFIRDRQFSPSRDGVKASSESALFTPRSSHAPLPPASPNPYLPHSRYARSRDGLLSPPPTFARDRYSQMTSTTRSGGTGYSGATGRSADSRYTGRSADSRVTGRSGRSGGNLGRVVEGRRGWEDDQRR